MSGIGPTLPPHLLAKRKRQQEEKSENERVPLPGAKRSPVSEDNEKRRRIIGPAMPPAPLDEIPSEVVTQDKSESSDEDDDFGPALPTAPELHATRTHNDDRTPEHDNPHRKDSEHVKRDEWMMMAPKQDDLAARMDPTIRRPKTFNTGKGARGGTHDTGEGSMWNETAEQKQKRLRDEIMGVSQPATGGSRDHKARSSGKRDPEESQIRAQIQQSRGPSLMERHSGRKGIEKEDDPSQRVFDKEKDMGTGMRIDNTQRTQMLNKASGYSSKFSGGGYL